MPLGQLFKDVGAEGGFGSPDSLFAGVNPAQLIATGVLAVYNGYRQRKELEKQRQEATAIHIELPGQSAAVSVVYGRFKSKATPLAVRVSGGYVAASDNPDTIFKAQRWHIPGESSAGQDRRSATSSATAGLDLPFSLSSSEAVKPMFAGLWSGPAGPINKVWWIKLNGVDHDFALWSGGQRIHVRNDGGADSLGTNNGIPADLYKDGRVMVTGVFRNNLLKPYATQRIPFDMDLYGEGKLIRTFMADGTLSTVLSYSNNPILVAIDYMTDPVHGWGLPDSMLNLASAKASADVCDKFMDALPGNEDLVVNRRGSVWRRPGEWDDQTPRYLKWSKGSRIGFIATPLPLFKVDREDANSSGKAAVRPPNGDWGRFLQGGKLYEFKWAPTLSTIQEAHEVVRADDDVTGNRNLYDHTKATSTFPAQVSKNPTHAFGPGGDDSARLRLYECNLEMDTTQPLRRNLFDVFDVVTGLRVFWWGGELNFSVQHPTTQAEEDALVEAVFTDDHIVGPVRVSHPQRLVKYTVDHPDEALDFESGQQEWPQPGSAEDIAARALFGMAINEKSGTYRGVSTAIHGRALAETEVRQSWRAKQIVFDIPRAAWKTRRVLPGAFIDVASPNSGLQITRAQVDSIDVGPDLVQVTAVKFSYLDLAMNINEAIAQPYMSTLDADDLIPAPETVVVTFDFSSRQFNVVWTLPAGEHPTAFADIRVRVNGGGWQDLAIVTGTTMTYPWTPGNEGGTYEFGVRQRTSEQFASEYTDSMGIPVVAVTPTLAVNTPPPDREFCWDYKNIGRIHEDGGYNLQDHNVFLLNAASDIGLLHRRFSPAQIAAGVEEPLDSAALPAGWTNLGTGPIDLANVPAAGISTRVFEATDAAVTKGTVIALFGGGLHESPAPTEWFEAGAVNPLVDRVRIFGADGRVELRFNDDDTSGAQQGPSLLAAVAEDVVITVRTLLHSVTFNGPTHSGSTVQDPTEPYVWTPSNSADLIAFFNAVSHGDSGTISMSYSTPAEDSGTVYGILYWLRPSDNRYTFFAGDDIKPSPVPDLPAGSEWVVRKIFQATSGESSVPTGGTDDGTDYIAPTAWSEAFQAPGADELAYGTLIRYRKYDGVDWEQVQGRGSYRRKTLAGNWYALTQKADTIRLGRRRRQRRGPAVSAMQDLVTALDVGAGVYMAFVYATDRWIEWRVESHSAYWIGNPHDPSRFVALAQIASHGQQHWRRRAHRIGRRAGEGVLAVRRRGAGGLGRHPSERQGQHRSGDPGRCRIHCGSHQPDRRCHRRRSDGSRDQGAVRKRGRHECVHGCVEGQADGTGCRCGAERQVRLGRDDRRCRDTEQADDSRRGGRGDGIDGGPGGGRDIGAGRGCERLDDTGLDGQPTQGAGAHCGLADREQLRRHCGNLHGASCLDRAAGAAGDPGRIHQRDGNQAGKHRDGCRGQRGHGPRHSRPRCGFSGRDEQHRRQRDPAERDGRLGRSRIRRRQNETRRAAGTHIPGAG